MSVLLRPTPWLVLALACGIGCGSPTPDGGDSGGAGTAGAGGSDAAGAAGSAGAAQAGTSSGKPACDRAPVTSCPTPAVTYAAVEPIFLGKCRECHDGNMQNLDVFTSYAAIVPYVGPIHDRILDCAMPPPEGKQLTDEEIATLLAWIECGAPE